MHSALCFFFFYPYLGLDCASVERAVMESVKKLTAQARTAPPAKSNTVQVKVQSSANTVACDSQHVSLFQSAILRTRMH